MQRHKEDASFLAVSTSKRKLFVVLYLLDDITDRPITKGQVSVRLEEQVKPIYKEDGWICLMDLPDGEHCFRLEGALYQPKTIHICTDQQKDTLVLTVRMIPSEIYQLPPDVIRVSGYVYPGQIVRLITRQEGSGLKLLQTYQGDRVLHLFSSSNTCMEGRSLCMDSGKPFMICAQVDEAQHIYLMDHPLDANYRKGYANIGVVHEVQADAQGHFFFPVRLLQRGYARRTTKTQCEVQVLDGGWMPQTVELQMGERQEVQMVEEESQ